MTTRSVRTLLLAFALAIAAGGNSMAAEPAPAATSAGQSAEASAGADPVAQPAAEKPSGKTDPAWGDGKVAGTRPTKEPAKGQPYNWTHMGLASLVMLAMLGFVLWLIRRMTRTE